jgi:hypothetical protein
VSEQTSFGRRQASQPVRAPRPAEAPRAREVRGPEALSPDAEAFRAQLKEAQPIAEPSFAAWRRTQQGRRYFAWLVSFALLCPGVLCFIFNAPLSVSLGLEALGFAVNYWVRRERKRHLNEIATWQSPT